MKTCRNSRTVESRNAWQGAIARGNRAALASMLHEPISKTDRRTRRVARRAGLDTALLDLIVLGDDGKFSRPTVTVVIDQRTKQILSSHLS
jgi:hypothetical protein